MNSEHDIETERLQRVIEEKKDQVRRTSSGNEVNQIYIDSFIYVYL